MGNCEGGSGFSDIFRGFSLLDCWILESTAHHSTVQWLEIFTRSAARLHIVSLAGDPLTAACLTSESGSQSRVPSCADTRQDDVSRETVKGFGEYSKTI